MVQLLTRELAVHMWVDPLPRPMICVVGYNLSRIVIGPIVCVGEDAGVTWGNSKWAEYIQLGSPRFLFSGEATGVMHAEMPTSRVVIEWLGSPGSCIHPCLE